MARTRKPPVYRVQARQEDGTWKDIIISDPGAKVADLVKDLPELEKPGTYRVIRKLWEGTLVEQKRFAFAKGEAPKTEEGES